MDALSKEFSRNNLTAAIDAETNGASKIKKAYNLVQVMIGTKLDVQPHHSETPSEYLLRIGEVAPSLLHALEPLVRLFELAEYSPYPIETGQVKDARDKLLELREELESVKTAEAHKP